jgi:hypothetical protein
VTQGGAQVNDLLSGRARSDKLRPAHCCLNSSLCVVSTQVPVARGRGLERWGGLSLLPAPDLKELHGKPF